MTKNSFYISLGVWLIIVPILGIPGIWRYRIIELTGLFLVIHSAWPAILKGVSQKPRIKKTKVETKKEESVVEPIVFSSPETEKSSQQDAGIPDFDKSKSGEEHVAQ